jgi:superfamily II DNA or RNA helicase
LPEKKQKREFTEKIDASFKLHDYQDFIKRKTSNFLLSDDQSKLMIQLPTGAGKTALAMHSIYDFLRVSEEENPLIVWMAHTDELCEQAIESFKMGWPGAGTKEITLMRLWGNTLKDLDQLPNTPVFAVASFQTANNMISSVRGEIFDLFLKIRDNSSLLIVDEAHMALAPTYNDAIEFFAGQNCKIIGLTATPGRHGIDGNTEETEELAEYFNGNIFDLNKFCGGKSPIEYLQDRGILSKVERLVLQTDFKINFTSSEIKKLESTGILSEKKLKESGSDEKRTNLIIDQIQKLVEKKKKILVFSPSKDSSNIYATLLKAKNIRAESVTGETSFNARKRAVTNFSEGKIDVLINYGVFTTGFDDPKINCIVVARPTYSVVLYSQMIGRGLRGPKNNGTEDCLIVDVLDNILNQPDIEIACNFFANEWI